MLSAPLVTVLVAPPLIWLMVRGRVRAERENPINRALSALWRSALSSAAAGD